MSRFGLIPFNNNPSTCQIIIPGVPGNNYHSLPPVGSESTVKDTKKDLYCNNCEYLHKAIKANNTSSISHFDAQCSAERSPVGNLCRIIKLHVYRDENIKKPFWCPIIKKEIINGALSSSQSASYCKYKAEREKKEKWLGMSGITAWNEICAGKIYHLPPTYRRKRMDLLVKSVNTCSLYCEDINTKNSVWLYKDEEEYKFLSLVK